MTTVINRAVLRARNSVGLPWAILAMGFLASFVLYAIIRVNIEDAAQERLEHQVTEAKRIIEVRIQSYVDVLYSVRALFGVDNQVSRVQFHDFVESLDLKNRYPGYEVVNYATYVRAEDRKQFE